MKPFEHTRKGEGYCCVNCDGPYSTWKKRTKSRKAKDNIETKKDIENQIDTHFICMDEDRESGAV